MTILIIVTSQTQTRRKEEAATSSDKVPTHLVHHPPSHWNSTSNAIKLPSYCWNMQTRGISNWMLKRPNAPTNLTSDLGETALLRWAFTHLSIWVVPPLLDEFSSQMSFPSPLRCTVLGYRASRHTVSWTRETAASQTPVALTFNEKVASC